MGLLAQLANDTRVTVGWQTRIAPTWTFDLSAIRAAADELGVRGRVEVGCAEYPRGRWGGMYSCEGVGHRIRVRRALTAPEASRILWHELTHALQEERGEREGTSHLRGDAYLSHPLEQEARANEWRAAEHPLVRETT